MPGVKCLWARAHIAIAAMKTGAWLQPVRLSVNA